MMRNLLKSAPYFPWHSFMVAWLPFLHFQQKNFRILDPWDGWGLLLVYWAVVMLLLATGRLAWGSFARAGLAVTPLVAVLAKGWALGPVVCCIFLGVSVATAVLLWRRIRVMDKLSLPVNMAVLVLVIFPLVKLLPDRAGNLEPQPGARYLKDADVTGLPDGSTPPDVYFLLVDGLGQPRWLEQAYGLPRQLLTSGLEEQGFRLLEQSRSNYPQTALSAAATLNMAPIHELLEIRDPLEPDRRPLAGIIRNSRVGRVFTDLGYQTVTFPSGYPLTRLSNVDHKFEPVLNPSFISFYVLSEGFLPLIQPLLGRGPADLSFALRRGRLNFIFDNLSLARRGVAAEKPVFVFAHILAPHPPFVFDMEGNAQPSQTSFTYGDGNDWHSVHDPDGIPYHRLWTGQAIHVMNRLSEAVAEILAASPRPPVIIIQGDHGPGSHTNWDSVRGTDLAERFSIFNAWHVPVDLDIPLRADQTSINTFPLLFNSVFGSRLPLAQDRHWFAKMKEPYNFFEVKE